jgi:hypothetical protein
MRLRLQRQSLSSPHIGLSLQATSVAEARCGQVNLSESQSWKSGLSTDPRTLTVLVAELTADIGAGTVGVLVAKDSHLLEKSSDLAPVREVSKLSSSRQGSSRQGSSRQGSSRNAFFAASAASLNATKFCPAELALPAARLQLPRLPTRLLNPPIEIHAPIRENELWVVLEQAFIVRHIRFDERVEGVEWWDSERVFRDYFRVWLAKELGQRDSLRKYTPHTEFSHNRLAQNDFMQNHSVQNDAGHDYFVQKPNRAHEARERQGLEALVYRDREQGKSYIHAIYD